MSLLGATLDLMRVVDPTTWEAIDEPSPGQALGWGVRLTFDNNPHTDPYGEPSKTVFVAAWDGKENRAWVEKGKVRYDGKGPLWPIKTDPSAPHGWVKSHGNLGSFVVAKGAEDGLRHVASFWTENTQGAEMVKSNVVTVEID